MGGQVPRGITRPARRAAEEGWGNGTGTEGPMARLHPSLRQWRSPLATEWHGPRDGGPLVYGLTDASRSRHCLRPPE